MVEPQIPASLDELSPAWLTDALARNGVDVVVTGVDVAQRFSGTNATGIIEVSTSGASDSLPPRLFVKLPPSNPAKRAAINRTGMGRNEVLFYRSLASQLSLRTPRVFVAEHDANDGSFVLVLEDLIAAGCELVDPDVGVSVAHAESAMADFAAIHVRYEDPAVRGREASWVVPSRRGSEYGRLRLQHALESHRHRLTEPFAAISELYIDRQDWLHDLWAEGPSTVLQGDSHLGNVFLDGSRLGFLDWGIINLGSPLRDVSYFLTMTLSVANRRAHERRLLELYLAHRADAGGVAVDPEWAWAAHRIHAAYTVVASCQIVEFPEGLSAERERFAAAFLAKTEAAIADLDSLAALRARQ